jgi:hypothetical protein
LSLEEAFQSNAAIGGWLLSRWKMTGSRRGGRTMPVLCLLGSLSRWLQAFNVIPKRIIR